MDFNLSVTKRKSKISSTFTEEGVSTSNLSNPPLPN